MKRHLLALGVGGLFPLLGVALVVVATGVEAAVAGVHDRVRH